MMETRRPAQQCFTERVEIRAPMEQVWHCLTDTSRMKAWMGEPEMDLRIDTDWTIGSPMVVRGIHHLPFENRGTVLVFEPPSRLAYTHLSSLSGLPDEPASHTTLAFGLAPCGGGTSLELRASGFPTESILKHLQFYWRGTLPLLRQHVERDPGVENGVPPPGSLAKDPP